jgi:hypothetical protein
VIDKAMAKKPEHTFTATIRFVGFKTEADRDRAYDLWVESQLQGFRLAAKETQKSESDTSLKEPCP